MPSERMSTGSGNTETTRVTLRQTPQGSQRQAQTPSRPLREYSPPRTAGKLVADVGLLEVEFLACLLLLILLLFTNTSETYANRVMSFMKRGTLLSVLFFVLAIVAASGQNAAKVAKGIGGMVFVATLLTTPSGSIFTALDSFFKADWTGTQESANDTSKSADAGTASGTGGSAAATFAQLPPNVKAQIEGQPVFTQVSGIGKGAEIVITGAKDFVSPLVNNILGLFK